MNRGRMKLGSSFERLVLQRSASRESLAFLHHSSETLRDFGLGAQVLADLGLHKIRLMIHSDRKIAALEGFGIEVVERIPIPGRRAAARREAQ
jgi:3,4-dihydroxy 2-butanone 4-phosphate synthase/GTP cyclohydrolase II